MEIRRKGWKWRFGKWDAYSVHKESDKKVQVRLASLWSFHGAGEASFRPPTVGERLDSKNIIHIGYYKTSTKWIRHKC